MGIILEQFNKMNSVSFSSSETQSHDSPHSVATRLGCMTRDQKVPGLNHERGFCGVDIYIYM